MPSTPPAGATVTPVARVAGWLLIACAVVAPLVCAWLGVRELARHLEGLQPDGDLEAGGGFALGVLLIELVFFNYLGSGLILAGLWRWVGRHAWSVFVTVACSSVVITLIGVALNWQ